ncbi:MAG: hypothetical protein LBI69_01285 [Puniceicoccales bacterium]|jgi:hypothetical protein|nr:hypothetical protein [Puniceicoccales bacterium]
MTTNAVGGSDVPGSKSSKMEVAALKRRSDFLHVITLSGGILLAGAGGILATVGTFCMTPAMPFIIGGAVAAVLGLGLCAIAYAVKCASVPPRGTGQLSSQAKPIVETDNDKNDAVSEAQTCFNELIAAHDHTCLQGLMPPGTETSALWSNYINACKKLTSLTGEKIRFDALLDPDKPPNVLKCIRDLTNSLFEIIEKMDSSLTGAVKFKSRKRSADKLEPENTLKFRHLASPGNPLFGKQTQNEVDPRKLTDEPHAVYSILHCAVQIFVANNREFLQPESLNDLPKVEINEEVLPQVQPTIEIVEGVNANKNDQFISEHFEAAEWKDMCCLGQGANEIFWGDAGHAGKKDFRKLLYDLTQGPSSALAKNNFIISFIRWHGRNGGHLRSALWKYENKPKFSQIDFDASDVTYRIYRKEDDYMKTENQVGEFLQMLDEEPEKLSVLFNVYLDQSDRMHAYVCTSAIHCGVSERGTEKSKADEQIRKNQELAGKLCENFSLIQYRLLAESAKLLWKKYKSLGINKKIVLMLTPIGIGAYANPQEASQGIVAELIKTLQNTDVHVVLNGYRDSDVSIWEKNFEKMGSDIPPVQQASAECQ